MKAIIFTDLDASLLHEETFSCAEIIDVLKDVLEENLNEDFVYRSSWKCFELISAKIHFSDI